jgi:hypothetical protein
MTKRGHILDSEILFAFKRFKSAEHKTDRAQCKACSHERSWQTTDLRIHLKRCKKYTDGKEEEDTEAECKNVTWVSREPASRGRNVCKTRLARDGTRP